MSPRTATGDLGIPPFALGNQVTVRAVEEVDAELLYSVVERNRAHLSRWMPWAPKETLETTREFIAASRVQIGRNQGFQAVIIDHGQIVGTLGFHPLDWQNRSSSMGYWLAEHAQGRGLMTRSVRALVDHAFASWGLNRIEIRAGVENRRSRAIPERLGFSEEGVAREAELIGEQFIDLAIYAMLAREWPRRG